MTEETEINPLRVHMVRNIIQQNSGEPLTIDALKGFFPPDFDLGLDDLQPHIDAAALAIEFEGEPEATPAPNDFEAGKKHYEKFKPLIEARRRQTEALPPQARAIAAAKAAALDTAKPVSDERPPATPEAIERATVRRLAADQTLANARVAVISAQNVERSARGKLAAAVSAFQTGFAPLTPDELKRQFVKEQAAIRGAVARGDMPGRPGPKIGKSVVDRNAFYGRGGNPARGDYRRGAFPSQAKGAPNYDPRRGAVVAQAKVPSER